MDLKQLREMFANSVSDAVCTKLENSLAITGLRLDKENLLIKIPDLKIDSGSVSVRLNLTRKQDNTYSCKIVLDDVPEVLRGIRIKNKYKGEIFVYCYGEQPRNIQVSE